MPKVIATKTTAVRRTKANEKRTTKLLTSGPTHSRHVAKTRPLLSAGRLNAGQRAQRRPRKQRNAVDPVTPANLPFSTAPGLFGKRSGTFNLRLSVIFGELDGRIVVREFSHAPQATVQLIVL